MVNRLLLDFDDDSEHEVLERLRDDEKVDEDAVPIEIE